MNPDIRFWNPYLSVYETEKIYGEKWLRFSYENILGRIGLWGMVKRPWFSKWYGKKMDTPESRSKICPFIEKYELNTDEFLDKTASYETFNQFFFRKLKPQARPVHPSQASVVFPADGRHLILPNLSKVSQVYAKGQGFDLSRLLGSENLGNTFREGSMVISRLCPVDYHRFHFSLSGKVGDNKLINGSLLSVNPIALRKRLSIFWENKRYLSIVENEQVGKVVQLLIGATCVGSVHITANENSFVEKGDEFGYFSFGGSCVMTIFPKNCINFREELLEQSAKGYETYFRFGEAMGYIA